MTDCTGYASRGSPPVTDGDGYYEVRDALPPYPRVPLSVTLKNGGKI